jgi:hypothetical protein
MIQLIKHKVFIAALIMFIPFGVIAQSGGGSVFSYLQLGMPSRIAAGGGAPLSHLDGDINLGLYNPSLISHAMDKQIALSFVDYFSDISAGYAAYSRTYDKVGSLAASLHFMNYGTFTETDVAGNITGEFTAADYALQLGWGRRLHPRFSLGASTMLGYSKLESYSATAVAMCLSGTYNSLDSLTSVSLIIRNIGRQIKPYIEGQREPVLSEPMISFSRKLAKAPLRIHIIATHLDKWDLTYVDPVNLKPTIDPLTGEKLPERKVAKFADKLARHIIAGASFSPSPSFQLNMGYNYLRRHELKLESRTAMVGFSWGIGLRISKFHLNYARAAYHMSGATNHFTITTSLSQW